MAYFDNAATTYPKPEEVYSFMDRFYRECGASVGRGHYSLSRSTAQMVAETRSLIQDLLHCPAKQVVFTPTATIALNMIIQGVINAGAKNIYISPFEHNAVTRTLHHYEKNGQISVYQLSVSQDLSYDLERIKYQFDANKPDFVIVSHASNVCGLVAPVEDIFSLAKKYSAITLVDMAQTAGLVDCNIGLTTFDFAVFAGHKTLYGPTGISGFVMNPEIKLPSVFFGGTGYESANQDMPDSIPEKFEMGTQNTSGLAGLNAALHWNRSQSIQEIWNREQEHRRRLLDLLSDYWFIQIIGNNPAQTYVGIVSCLIDGISSDSAAGIFDRCGISVRTGLQCAPLAHQFLGTYPAGTIRFSVSYFSTDEDFEELRKALDFIEENL
jgi:cysteine desulfurase family protein